MSSSNCKGRKTEKGKSDIGSLMTRIFLHALDQIARSIQVPKLSKERMNCRELDKPGLSKEGKMGKTLM